ncbi:MAG TPA: NADH-quinone oxidoreductase subunit M [Planctomycetota bacterium]|nr:NADH-quinone oxidoreductase subunit M [Planctomycetota bacterium]
MNEHLLSLTVWIPIVGALLVVLAPKSATKGLATAASFLAMVASILVALRFQPNGAKFQLEEHHAWIKTYNIEYYLGVDGISVTMVLLTGILSFICILASFGFEHWHTSKGIKGYFALFLLLEAGMMGVFEALDFFLFYVFWEMMLLPMYFLIGIWGGPRREYAAIKFFLYTLAGSVLMLVVMLAMYFTYDAEPNLPGRQGTFNLVTLMEHGREVFTGPPGSAANFWWKMAFLGLFIGFAIKVPVFPFHTWLPDAHVEAPTPISVILAGVLLKMGTYGLMRISYPILPDAALWFAPFMMAFGTWNIIYGSLCAMAQIRGVPRVNSQTGERFVERDLKKMIAYSSVAHMGFCLLGLAACNPAGLSACLFQMWNHGIITSMLFLLVGVIYDRAHHRNIDGFGGLWTQMPHYGALTALAFMASLGLPGLSGFVSEFLSFAGGFQAGNGTYKFDILPGREIDSDLWFRWLTGISVAGVVLGAGYFLWSYQKVFQGPLNPKYANLEDISVREMITVWPLAILAVILGVYPSLYLDVIQPAINNLATHMAMPWLK